MSIPNNNPPFSPSFDDTEILMTASGLQLDPANPDPSSVSLEDIAHGLAQQCRSAGQTVSFYSVGLHSIYVSEELGRLNESPHVQLYELLHDAAEAYLSDVPAPVKHHLNGYTELESIVQNAIWDAFDLQPPDQSTKHWVKTVDRYLREYEFATILPHFVENTSPPDLPYDLHADQSVDVKNRFVSRATKLCSECGAHIPE